MFEIYLTKYDPFYLDLKWAIQVCRPTFFLGNIVKLGRRSPLQSWPYEDANTTNE